jgi:hypothetical protein
VSWSEATNATAAVATVLSERGDIGSHEALSPFETTGSKASGVGKRDGDVGGSMSLTCSPELTSAVVMWHAAASLQSTLSFFADGSSSFGSGGRPCAWTSNLSGQAIAGCQPKGSIVVSRQILVGVSAVLLTGVAVPMGGYEASQRAV